MNYNFRKKDTLEIFNERWQANKIDIDKIKQNNIKLNSPSYQAKRISDNLNKLRNNKFK